MAEEYISKVRLFSKKYDMKDLGIFLNKTFGKRFWNNISNFDKKYPEFIILYKEQEGEDF